MDKSTTNKLNNLISVVVPVYNVFEYIDACISSIVEQDYQHLEILLINDGSTDGSWQKCIDWSTRDIRIKCISQEHQGLGATRNNGVNQSTGNYITFIDSDDIVEPNYVSQLYEAIISEDADIAAAYMDRTDCTHTYIPKGLTNIVSGREAMDMMCSGDIIVNATCKLYKRDLIRNTAFVENLLYEDNVFIVDVLAKCSTLAICREILYHHIIRSDSITQTHSVSNYLDMVTANNIAAEHLRKYYSSSDYGYVSRLINNWLRLNYYYHRYYEHMMSNDECAYIKGVLCQLRRDVMNNVDYSQKKMLSTKTRMKLCVLKYAPNLSCSLMSLYKNITKARN